jgi:hypothetical protein
MTLVGARHAAVCHTFHQGQAVKVRDNPFVLDVRNRILMVVIWLRMYPEVVMLSGLFMVSPTTVKREFRFLLPVLWNYFNSFSSGDKFHIFHSIASDINISTSIYPPLKRKPPLRSS